MRQVPEQVVLDQTAGIVEIAERFRTALGRHEEFFVMPQRGRNERVDLVALELGLRRKQNFAVVGDHEPLFADERDADPPVVDGRIVADHRLKQIAAAFHSFRTVVPDQLDLAVGVLAAGAAIVIIFVLRKRG